MDCATIAGGKLPFVLLPGLYTKSLMPLAPAVARQYRRFLGEYTIYMLDRVSEPPERYTVQDMVGDTIQALEQLGLRDVFMMGVSAGGVVAQAIAAERPDLVRRVVIGSSTSQMTEHARQILRNWISLARAGKVDELNCAFAGMIYTDSFYARYKEAIIGAHSYPTEAELRRFAIFAEALCDFGQPAGKITCPLLAIGAEQDRIFGAEGSREIARRNGGRVFIYKDYGHAVYDEAPDYLDKVWEFFQSETERQKNGN